ncbi:MAG: DNA-directed RNA polymerase subunit omega [Acidimicrobiales bacterium]|nr:DNA-directed RNA polymerase subunit omega [Acidimicrobiales bacterium]
MTEHTDSMMEPSVEELLRRTDSKFGLCTFASTRARQINAYFGDLNSQGVGAHVPPQVASVARKPLSIAFEEIAADKIIRVALPDPLEVAAAEAAAKADAEAAGDAAE